MRRALLGTLLTAAALATFLTAGAYARPPVEGEPTLASAPPFAVTYGAGLTFQHTALAALAGCSSGARTLSAPGSIVYPDQGNGGYTSLHTDLHLLYDTSANLLLPGTHADLRIRTTQCLTDFSFDFERAALSGALTGPNMTVESVTVDGQPATFTFKQPTYPGDPNGPDDPDPDAHAISNVNPVSATNANPPACSPQVNGTAQNGQQCPANKLVITPATPLPEGTTHTVTIDYLGRPGLHFDGDGTTEGWFRVNTTAAPNDGAFVTTEPVGNQAWMPLNNHPSAKPTYDVYDTVPVGKTAIGPGELVGFTPPTGPPGSEATPNPTAVNPPDANFPGGSWLWHWHSPEPIASYLVENSIGSYDLIARLGADGVQYFQGQGSAITRKAINKIAMDNQEDITTFQRIFNGAYPFTTAGVVVGIPSASFEEEMQTKITFAGGSIGGASGTSLGTLNHENMHQWFGDNVAESAFNLTFWKEGFARLGEYLNNARSAAAGGSSGPAFETSLKNQFNTTYGTSSTTFWTGAPSKPTVGTLFNTSFTYNRPGTAYLALWQILGRDRMISAMHDIQATYGGSSITEQQLEDLFSEWLPIPSASCNARLLDQFFPEWWDTAFPGGGANTTNKPTLSGPGLNGTGFVCAQVTPATPDGNNGWYTGDVSIDWQGYGASAFTKDGCVDGPVTDEGTTTRSCSVTTTAPPILSSGAASETVMRDSREPEIAYTGNAGSYTIDQQVTIHCSASDPVPGSGLDPDSNTCKDLDAPAWSLPLGTNRLSATAEDVAGNEGEGSATFTVGVTFDSLHDVVVEFSSTQKVAKKLNKKLDEAEKAKKDKDRVKKLDEFEKKVTQQVRKGGLTADEGSLLISFAEALK
jgi:peptidase M1-like protein